MWCFLLSVAKVSANSHLFRFVHIENRLIIIIYLNGFFDKAHPYNFFSIKKKTTSKYRKKYWREKC